MAVEIFLKLDGVTGGSRNYHHTGWADVLGWRWQLERADGGAHFNEIVLTKPLGIESPALMSLLATGRSVGGAQLDIVPVVGKREAQQKYVTMSLAEVAVQAIHISGAAEDAATMEEVTLRFGNVKFDFHHQGAPAADGRPAAVDVYSFEGTAAPG